MSESSAGATKIKVQQEKAHVCREATIQQQTELLLVFLPGTTSLTVLISQNSAIAIVVSLDPNWKTGAVKARSQPSEAQARSGASLRSNEGMGRIGDPDLD